MPWYKSCTNMVVLAISIPNSQQWSYMIGAPTQEGILLKHLCTVFWGKRVPPKEVLFLGGIPLPMTSREKYDSSGKPSSASLQEGFIARGGLRRAGCVRRGARTESHVEYLVLSELRLWQRIPRIYPQCFGHESMNSHFRHGS